jgi:hypothetical protein
MPDKTIELDQFHPIVMFPKKMVKEWGGHAVVKALIDDILDRYCNSEYFDFQGAEEGGWGKD